MTADPTETWRAALAASGKSASARLAETQAALAASQADLTHMEAERDELRSEVERLVELGSKALAERDALAVLVDELNAEAAHWHATANRHLTHLGDLVKALATANYQNRLLTAENEAALRRLNETHIPSSEERP